MTGGTRPARRRRGLILLLIAAEQPAQTAAEQVADLGAGTIIYTDIATDGMLAGPNFAELDVLLETLSCNLVASGGVCVAITSCPGCRR